ncbi:MAG: hypothetical protein WAT71_11825 [Ignavibacteria bacterium]
MLIRILDKIILAAGVAVADQKVYYMKLFETPTAAQIILQTMKADHL